MLEEGILDIFTKKWNKINVAGDTFIPTWALDVSMYDNITYYPIVFIFYSSHINLYIYIRYHVMFQYVYMLYFN